MKCLELNTCPLLVDHELFKFKKEQSKSQNKKWYFIYKQPKELIVYRD